MNLEEAPPPKELTRSQWYALIEEWQSSSLSQSDFCRQKTVSYNTFTYFRGKMLKERNSLPKTEFTPVAVPTTNAHHAMNQLVIERSQS